MVTATAFQTAETISRKRHAEITPPTPPRPPRTFTTVPAGYLLSWVLQSIVCYSPLNQKGLYCSLGTGCQPAKAASTSSSNKTSCCCYLLILYPLDS
jgi:hypothetical protein